MSLPDFTAQIGRIAAHVAELPDDPAAMVQELRALERALRTAVGTRAVEVWVPAKRGTMAGFTSDGFRLDLLDGTRVNPFETAAYVSELYSAAATLVDALEAEVDPSQRRIPTAGAVNVRKLTP